MDKRRALAALLALSLGSCSRHEHLAPINYSPPTTGLSDIEIRTAIVQQSITSYQGPCPCPYSAPTCQGHSAYDETYQSACLLLNDRCASGHGELLSGYPCITRFK